MMSERTNDPQMQQMYQDLMNGIGKSEHKNEEDDSNIIDVEDQELIEALKSTKAADDSIE